MAAKKKKAGRQPRSKGEPKGYVLNFYPSERAKLKKIAKLHEMSEAAAIRMLIDAHFAKKGLGK